MRSRIRENTIDAAQATAMAAAAAASGASGPVSGFSAQVLTTIASGVTADVAPVLNMIARKRGHFLILGATSGAAGIGSTNVRGDLYATIGTGSRNVIATLEMAGLAGLAALGAATNTGCTMIAILGIPVGSTLALEMAVTPLGGSYIAAPAQGILIALEF